VRDVEVAELIEGVRAGDVRVEDKERRVVLAENFASEGERTSRAEGLGLDREGDGDLFRFDRTFARQYRTTDTLAGM
jgi:hypothetical protein